MPSAFDPANVATGWVLSNGNRTATHGASATDNYGRSLTTQNRGKFYFGVHKDSNAGADGTIVGLTTGATLNGFLGNVGVGMMEQGSVYVGNTTPVQATYTTSGLNDIEVAIDLDNQKIWGRINGGLWNNSGTDNPATNTGGISFASLGWTAGTTNVYLSAGTAGASVAITIKTQPSEWANPAPAGFGEWNDQNSIQDRTSFFDLPDTIDAYLAAMWAEDEARRSYTFDDVPIVNATLAQTLAALTATATASFPVAATSSPTLGAVISAATASFPIAATLAQTLGALTLAATGTNGGTNGVVNATLGALVASATGVVRVAALLASTLDQAILVATATNAAPFPTNATVSATLADVVLTATAHVEFTWGTIPGSSGDWATVSPATGPWSDVPPASGSWS